MGRAAAVLIVAASYQATSEAAPHLSPLATWPSVAVVALVLMPAVFSLTWLALPLWRRPAVLAVGVAVLTAATLLLSLLGAPVFANLAKFGAVTCLGLLFLSAFEAQNDEALRFARKYDLTVGAGSDAHVLQGVGTGALRMRAFRGPEEFMISLGSAEVLRRPKSLAYLQSLKWMAQVKEKVR